MKDRSSFANGESSKQRWCWTYELIHQTGQKHQKKLPRKRENGLNSWKKEHLHEDENGSSDEDSDSCKDDDNGTEGSNEDEDQTEGSDENEDQEDGSDEDNGLSEKVLSVKDWEQSDEDDFGTDLEEDEEDMMEGKSIQKLKD
ncbi:uncharacterized protein [Aristolochia californica]|uniref:uncharacterized protein n=1 Tax=Aristolochia californica TaxID=171875 RepID=UPI0035E307BB